MPSPWKVSPSPSFSDFISSVNCRSTEKLSHLEKQNIKDVWILYDFRSVERGAKNRGVGVLAAQAAAHAALDYGGHRVAAQGIGVVLEGERRAAREPDAGVVSGAGVLVDSAFDSHHSFTRQKPLLI